ncbi:acetyl-CoA acetyltransferase [Eilatimonas milleporae]|uniref:Acetyl-CoA C-acetyltransferase n=1 Tax=Eilatimonas milleporae TaxID=911205 RepID=A0A3M0CRK3_9PROT|nr:acetyl-CoA acetyltransferase [Eilatimonas milleporae]RMB12108.1 acetyl-CoA C-acetyltransferase [Eilatimonas milleporae]
MAEGIRDKVAIIGMGCSKFGERWDMGPEDLVNEAFEEAIADAGIDKTAIEAAWFGVFFDEQNVGKSAYPLSQFLRLPNIPVTRVENLCATGTEALRGAVYAVAAGACDIALAVGVEKLKDTGFSGLPERTKGTFEDLYQPGFTAPGAFAQLGAAYAAKHGMNMDDLKRAMAHVSWKSHENGARNEKAHLRRRLAVDDIIRAPMIAYPLGVYDCCGVSDGAACAIVARPEIAKSLVGDTHVTIKAMQLAPSNGVEMGHQSWDGAHTLTTRKAADRAYREAGISDPVADISLTEVHDCFSITELVLMEDLGLSPDGRAPNDILDGRYDAAGAIPCQIDGGLKCFGHPIGASGLRMTYEIYLQLLGRAGGRQLPSPKFGLAHNLGGIPNRNVAAVSIFGVSD